MHCAARFECELLREKNRFPFSRHENAFKRAECCLQHKLHYAMATHQTIDTSKYTVPSHVKQTHYSARKLCPSPIYMCICA